MMDPTDARRVVRDLCLRLGVDLYAVLGRDRTTRVVEARRHCVVALRKAGASHRVIAKLFRRVPGTIGEMLSPFRRGSHGRRVATRSPPTTG